MAYNRDHFFETFRAAHGPLKAPQVEGFNAIIAEAELRRFDKRWTAYVLATAWWESAKAMQPVPEIGKGHERPYGTPDKETGQIYYGRGLVQITWKMNYAKMAKLVGVDLVAHPDLALELGVAVDILFDGMQLGTFTGKRLVDYFTASRTDWTGARHIVNGTDHAADIAALATGFDGALIEVPATPVTAAAPAPAKPAPAPVAAAPADHPATTKETTMSTAAAKSTASHNVLADMITGIETKIKDSVSALENGTAQAAGASDKVTAAIGSVPSGVDAAKHLATLALNVRSGNFAGAGKDVEAILGDVSTILGKFGVNLPLLTEANSILVKYVG